MERVVSARSFLLSLSTQVSDNRVDVVMHLRASLRISQLLYLSDFTGRSSISGSVVTVFDASSYLGRSVVQRLGKCHCSTLTTPLHSLKARTALFSDFQPRKLLLHQISMHSISIQQRYFIICVLSCCELPTKLNVLHILDRHPAV
jgi:hypothetical protein